MDNIIISQLIKELKKISTSQKTPYMSIDGDKESFNRGWYLAINRILNKLKKKEIKMEIIGWIFTIGTILLVIGLGLLYMYAKGFGGK